MRSQGLLPQRPGAELPELPVIRAPALRQRPTSAEACTTLLAVDHHSDVGRPRPHGRLRTAPIGQQPEPPALRWPHSGGSGEQMGRGGRPTRERRRTCGPDRLQPLLDSRRGQRPRESGRQVHVGLTPRESNDGHFGALLVSRLDELHEQSLRPRELLAPQHGGGTVDEEAVQLSRTGARRREAQVLTPQRRSSFGGEGAQPVNSPRALAAASRGRSGRAPAISSDAIRHSRAASHSLFFCALRLTRAAESGASGGGGNSPQGPLGGARAGELSASRGSAPEGGRAAGGSWAAA
jgi:hypothetical protein